MKTVIDSLRARSGKLSRRNRILAAAGLFAILGGIFGPFAQFVSASLALEHESLLRAKTVMRLFAAKNELSIVSQKRPAYDIRVAMAEKWVKKAFITDPDGVIVWPESMYREDANRYDVVRSARLTGKTATSEGSGVLRIAEPLASGGVAAGVAFMEFSDFAVGWPLQFWFLIRTIMIMALIGGASACLIIKCDEGAVVTPVIMTDPGNTHSHDRDILLLARHIDRPVCLLDGSFTVVFANHAAQMKDQNVSGKHIMDMDPRLVAMAEQLEMLQSEHVKEGDRVIWRTYHMDGGIKYGLIF